MYLRIHAWLWLSFVVVAGCVLAEEVGAPLVSNGVETPSGGGADIVASASPTSDRYLFLDDEPREGSGGGPDPDLESSGSGWGPDDEDARSGVAGSGAGSVGGELPTDDEDYAPKSPASAPPPSHTTGSPLAPVVVEISSPRPREEIQTRVFTQDVSAGAGTGTDQGAGLTPLSGGNRDDITVEDKDEKTPEEGAGSETRPSDNVVFIMNKPADDRAISFFAQPGILIAVIGGAVVGLLCAILVVMFIVYRMRKKDEGSYALDEPKRSPAAASYGKGQHNREFYA